MIEKLFEVLVWNDDVTENTFETLEEAQKEYEKIVLGKDDRGKQIMKYASMDDDADGEILEEEWSE